MALSRRMESGIQGPLWHASIHQLPGQVRGDLVLRSPGRLRDGDLRRRRHLRGPVAARHAAWLRHPKVCPVRGGCQVSFPLPRTRLADIASVGDGRRRRSHTASDSTIHPSGFNRARHSLSASPNPIMYAEPSAQTMSNVPDGKHNDDMDAQTG